MTDCMKVQTNADGTATATVGTMQQTFPDLYTAVEWATAVLYELEGDECG
jgi:hypothetical protein